MRQLVIITFNKKDKAEKMMARLKKLEKHHKASIKHEAVVKKKANSDIEVDHDMGSNVVAAKMATWTGMGSAIGSIAFPWGTVVGALAGIGGGAIDSLFRESKTDEHFVNKVKDKLTPDSSALIVSVKSDNDKQLMKIFREVQSVGGEVHQTGLSEEDEQRLQNNLEKNPRK